METLATKDACDLLDADHIAVKHLFVEYARLSVALPDSLAERQALATKICAELTVHAQIEEEIFYPAAREAMRSGEDLLDEAEVEHGSLKELVAAIEDASPDSDDLFEARVKVLGEYVKHHVKEEERELFPQIRKSDMDLAEIGRQLMTRKRQLMRELKGDA
jgi:iron-sulfur cluster repair protein YtfE (RIC family)